MPSAALAPEEIRIVEKSQEVSVLLAEFGLSYLGDKSCDILIAQMRRESVSRLCLLHSLASKWLSENMYIPVQLWVNEKLHLPSRPRPEANHVAKPEAGDTILPGPSTEF